MGEYCVKIVPLESSDAASRVAKATEAWIHGKLNHHGVVKYYHSWLDTKEAVSQFCMLLELCKSDLWTCLEEAEPSMDERRRWSLQLTGALEHIHSHGIVHRDINPWNVLVTHARDLKIGDFGLSVLCDSSSMLSGWTSPGAVPLNSSAIDSLYSAPELGDYYNQQADVFSLGMTLFAIWHPGSLSEGADDLISAVETLRETCLLPEWFELQCPVVGLIHSMVMHEPNQRPSAKQVHSEMQRICSP